MRPATRVAVAIGAGALGLLAVATLFLAFVVVESPSPSAIHSGRRFVDAMGKGDVEGAVAVADPALADGVRRLAKERPEIWGPSIGSSSVSHRGGLDVTWTGVRPKSERVEVYEVTGRDGKVRSVTIDSAGTGNTCLVREISVDNQPLLFVLK
jgi:hypothetical protein